MFAILFTTAASVWGLAYFYPSAHPTKPSLEELAGIFVVDTDRQFPEITPVYGTLPGEFEPHEALLIGWPKEAPFGSSANIVEHQHRANQTLIELVANTPASLRILVVVPSPSIQAQAEKIFARAGVLERVELVLAEIDSPWVRDSAPFPMRSEESLWIAARFYRLPGKKPLDAKFAKHFSAQSNVSPIEMPLYIDGGNLISNGQGLLITTTHTLDKNREQGYQRNEVSRLLKQYFGAKQIVYLEPLHDEATEHVDMFLTMPDPDTVVLAEYTPEQDAVNHAVLERNLQRLREVERDEGPLKIVRIPMTPRGEALFGGTYANVVYANGVLFVPRFGEIDPEGHAKAIAIYQQLLPDWKIHSVEASAWLVADGSIHCLTKNFYRIPDSVRR